MEILAFIGGVEIEDKITTNFGLLRKCSNFITGGIYKPE